MTLSSMMDPSSSVEVGKFPSCNVHRIYRIYHSMLQHSESSMPRKRSSAVQLVTGLRRLATLLAALPRDCRHAVIQMMSSSIKAMLVCHMEVHAFRSEKQASDAEALGRKRKRESTQLNRSSKHKSVSVARVESATPAHSGLVRGICQMQTRWGLRFFARLTVSGVAISSGCFRTLREAEDCQKLLIKLREALREMCASEARLGDADDAVLRRFRINADSDQSPMRLRFRATIDARRWVGRTLSSPQMSSFAEAWILRSKLEKAREQGWEALRVEWAECIQSPRRSTRFGHTMDAEARVLAIETRFRLQRDFSTKQGTALLRTCLDDLPPRHNSAVSKPRKQKMTICRAEWRVHRLLDRLERLFLKVEAVVEKNASVMPGRRFVHSGIMKR